MKRIVPILLSLAACTQAGVETYQITWTTPSIDSLDSMPLSGRMGAGANVWVQDGSIWLYLAHSGAFDERGRLLKLGCVRITPENVDLGKEGFVQQLNPATGTISISQGDFKASLWFAGQTLVYQSEQADAKPLEVSFASWRDKDKSGLKLDMFRETDMKGDQIEADTSGFVWSHRNEGKGIDVMAMGEGRGIEKSAILDATTRRVSGGAVAVSGGLSKPVESAVQWQFWDGKAWTGKTQPRKSQVITMRLGGALDAQPSKWKAEATAALNPAFLKTSKADELKRWNDFWSRSHVMINAGAAKDDPGYLIGQNYQFFRYMLATNRDGELPLFFNGGIFTTDNKPGRITGNNNDELPISAGGPSTPDFRRWMFCYFMSQNQRWLGWPNLANGDAEMLSPSVRFYRDRSPAAFSRGKRQGAEGAVYVEPLDIWGFCSGDVGPRPDGLTGAGHLTYHFSMGIEHAWMTLQAHDTLGTPIEKDLPWIAGTVFFYDSFYRKETKARTGKELGDDGKLVIYPGNGLEFAGGATNAVDAVCGLTRVTDSLLKLPQLSAASRQRLARIQRTLPEIPTGIRQGGKSVLAARSLESENNKWEPIEMYAYWPYRLVGITNPSTLQLARDTWDTIPEDRARLCKQDYSWMANVANMAALASPEKAKERAIYKMANTAAPQARFPAFFGPGHDWLPDHNWGGSGMTGIQEMLLAPEPGINRQTPPLPRLARRLGRRFQTPRSRPNDRRSLLKGGKLVSLKVTPESREKDIVNWLGKHPEWKPFAPPVSLGQGKPITASSQFNEPGYEASNSPTTAIPKPAGPRTSTRAPVGSKSTSARKRKSARVLVSEIEWKETREFTIEVKQGDAWKEVARGTTIGANKDIAFPPGQGPRRAPQCPQSANAHQHQRIPGVPAGGAMKDHGIQAIQ